LVFICHASEDQTVAMSIATGLEQRGISSWIAPRDVEPGAPYATAIVEAISRSRALVLVFSAHANESPHVVREVERAVSRKIQLIPVRISDVEPSTGLEYFISTAQWVDASDGSLDHQLDTLARVLGGRGTDEAGANAREALRQLVVRYGDGLAADSRRTQALLRDVAGPQRLEVAALVAAAEEGAGPALLQSSDARGTMDRMVRRLGDNRGLREEVAQWAVESWAYALDVLAPPASPVEPMVDGSLDETLPAREAEGVGRHGRPTSTPARPGTAAAAADVPEPSTSRLAVWALVLGVLWLYWVGSIAALITGRQALKQIDGSEGRLKGRNYAIGGIVAGWIGVALFVVGLIAYLINPS
jgi:hypothetical protein